MDASQLLSRVSPCSHDVGARWQELTDCWAQPAAGDYYVFNDMHALMAYASAGRDDQVRGILATLTQRAIDPDTNGHNTREVGLPFARAIVAMVENRPAEAVELLLSVRSKASRIGGSHAQGDLVHLSCIEAILRSGNGRLTRSLASERTEHKPASAFNLQLTTRALDAFGDVAAAKGTREHAKLRRRAQLRRSAA